MDFKFNKDNEDRPSQVSSGNKSNQNVLLAVLLVVAAVAGYLYFFTGLIKPQVENKPAEAPAPQVVKNPIPARNGETGKTAPTPSAAPSAAPAAPAAPAATVPPAAPAAKQEAKVAQSPQPPAKAPAKKAEPTAVEVKKTTPAVKEQKTAKAEEKKTVKADDKKPAPEKKQPKPAEQKVAAKPEKEIEKKPAAPKKTAEAAKATRFTVVVGSYLLEDALAPDLAQVRKAGLDPAVTAGGRKKASMNRLFVAEYNERTAAQAELEKLRRYTSDAFIMDHAGKAAVYAGSYLLSERAASEKERLEAAGFSLTLKKVELGIPAKKLTAGTFTSRSAAEAALKKLKDAGLKSAHIAAQ